MHKILENFGHKKNLAGAFVFYLEFLFFIGIVILLGIIFLYCIGIHRQMYFSAIMGLFLIIYPPLLMFTVITSKRLSAIYYIAIVPTEAIILYIFEQSLLHAILAIFLMPLPAALITMLPTAEEKMELIEKKILKKDA